MRERRKGRSPRLAAGSRGSTCPPQDVAAAAGPVSAAEPLEGGYPPVALAAEPATSVGASTTKGGKKIYVCFYIGIFC